MPTGITRDQHLETAPKPLTPREKVKAWLDSVQASPDEQDEIIDTCVKDKEVRAYFLSCFDRDCK